MRAGTVKLYAIPVTTMLVRNRSGQRIKGEWAVEEAMSALGCSIHDTRTVEFLRKGKQRYATPEYRQALPGYVFASIPDELFGAAVHVKGAWGSALPIIQVQKKDKLTDTPYDQAMRFFAMLKEKRDEAERIKTRADLVAEFDPGEPLEILRGPFSEQLVTFQKMVHSAHDLFPKLRVEMEIMGRKTTVDVDPLDVKSAAE